jgi:hypothetical protein
MANNTITLWNSWIADPQITVQMVTAVHVLDADAIVTILETNSSQSVVRQLQALRLDSLFYSSNDTEVLSLEAVGRAVNKIVDWLRPMNPVFADVGLQTGGPMPLCSVDKESALECVECYWQDQLDLLYNNNSVFAPWPFSRYETNAIYNPLDNTVYIPSGILQLPFYSDAWAEAYQVASLGYIIAHEVRPPFIVCSQRSPPPHVCVPCLQFSHSLPLDPVISKCIDLVETGLTLANNHQQSTLAAAHRANLTLPENYADHYGLHYTVNIVRQNFGQNTRFLKTVFLVWAQTWCSGSPDHHSQGDTHQSSRLRVNASLEMSFPFTGVYGCTQRYPPCF